MADIKRPVKNSQVNSTSSTPSTKLPLSSPQPGIVSKPNQSNFGPAENRKFNAITATGGRVSLNIFGSPGQAVPIGNTAEIMVSGISGTPQNLIERILEHDPSLALLHTALA